MVIPFIGIGDGTTSTDINPQHTYMNNGKLRFSLLLMVERAEKTL
jgi:hypothetical protein